MLEVWNDILGYEGFYQVSTHGRVKSVVRCVKHWRGGMLVRPETILKPSGTRYAVVALCKEGVVRHFTVHKLVALTFVPNPNDLPEVNHKDTNKSNNRADNLEWTDRQGNVEHASNAGCYKGRQGSKNNWAKLDEDKVRTVLIRLAAGEKGRTLARELNVSEGLITCIKQRKIWTHVRI